jgi:hypothetical protein
MRAPVVGQVSKVIVVPAPIGGLNAADSVVSMQETDAIIMRNFFPQPYGCSVRKGYREHQTLPISAPIETLITCTAATDNEAVVGSEQKLFAASGGVIYDVSLAGLAPVSVVTGLGALSKSNRFQTVSLSQTGKSYTFCVNGVTDPVVIEYPSTIHRLVAGNGTTDWTVAGVDPKTWIHVIVYKKSLWFTQIDSSKCWFFDPGVLWGTPAEFDFGPYMTRGGYVMALATWSVDDSNNTQSRLVAITSAGEALVFEGEDPTDATKWANIGTYYISPPIGRRCFEKYNSDLLILTQQGIVSMFDVSRGEIDELFSMGNGRIVQQLFSDLTAVFGYKFGWEVLNFPRGNMIMVNIPSDTDTLYTMLVLNTITKGWCRFESMPAFCLALYYNQPMFALEDTIYTGWVGHKDRVNADGSGGEDIVATCQQAYSYLGSPGNAKHIKMIRPTFITSGDFSYKAAINLDFSFEGTYGLVQGSNFGSSLWDSAKWDDANARWSESLSVSQQWVGAYGIGHTVSIKLKTSSTKEVMWVSTQVVYEDGGVI